VEDNEVFAVRDKGTLHERLLAEHTSVESALEEVSGEHGTIVTVNGASESSPPSSQNGEKLVVSSDQKPSWLRGGDDDDDDDDVDSIKISVLPPLPRGTWYASEHPVFLLLGFTVCSLCADIWYIVAIYLPLRDILTLRRVNHYFERFSNSSKLWYNLLLRDFSAQLDIGVEGLSNGDSPPLPALSVCSNNSTLLLVIGCYSD
jgi:hypothetical protein